MTAAVQLMPEPTRSIDSHLLGSLVVTESRVFGFPDGLPGFPACREWVLVDAGSPGCAWLQSTSERMVTFFVVDPFLFIPGYSVDLPSEQLTRLPGTATSEGIAILCIATLPGSAGEGATVNLQGPLVLDVRTRLGAQMIIADSKYGLRHPIELIGLG
ncbi:MAG: flagellar assembly protein FliW [Gemmatimonadaceae bacterium]|nr:flagellar assembly protein FliW [Gemmatimonadaceae bacterium]